MAQGLVERTAYLDHLRSWKDRAAVVKVVTGMRRCGKSTLLEQYRGILESEGAGNIFMLNFESSGMDDITDYRSLNRYLSDRLDRTGRNYVLLDEIQRVSGWERSVNSLQVDYDADIYITGSNAHLLSSELATFLSGRYVEIKMLPFSFKEYLLAHPVDGKNTVDVRFSQFVSKGGIPMVEPGEPVLADELLGGIYSTIIRKDVSMRLRTLDLMTLDSIVAYLMSNIGSITSSAAVAKALEISPVTAKRYLQALEDAFLIYKAYRFDVRGKKLLKSTEKYYCSDTGIRNTVLRNRRNGDTGHLIENVVYLELVRKGYTVRVGSYYDKEIDFIAETDDGAEYIQVAASVLDENTFSREITPLESVPNHCPKLLLTLDRVIPPAVDGIRIMNLVDWLQL